MAQTLFTLQATTLIESLLFVSSSLWIPVKISKTLSLQFFNPQLKPNRSISTCCTNIDPNCRCTNSTLIPTLLANFRGFHHSVFFEDSLKKTKRSFQVYLPMMMMTTTTKARIVERNFIKSTGIHLAFIYQFVRSSLFCCRRMFIHKQRGQ